MAFSSLHKNIQSFSSSQLVVRDLELWPKQNSHYGFDLVHRNVCVDKYHLAPYPTLMMCWAGVRSLPEFCTLTSHDNMMVVIINTRV